MLWICRVPVGHSPFNPSLTKANSRLSFSPTVSFQPTIDSSPCEASKKEQSTNVSDLPLASVNMIGRGREPLRARRGKHDTNSPLFSSPDSDYSPGLDQVLVGQEGAFWGTRFRVAIPYNYEQPSSSSGVMSPEPLKSLFQWSDDEGETSGYASLVTVSSVQIGRASVNMADNNNDDLRQWMEAQEQTFRDSKKL